MDILCGALDAEVLAEAAVFDQMVAELGPIPGRPFTDTELCFDEAPWLQLPSLRDLQPATSSLEGEIHQLAIKVHGLGEDLPRFIAQQRELARLELQWARERLESDVVAESVGVGGAGEVAGDVSVDAEGGGDSVSGGDEDSVTVGEERGVAVHGDGRGASKVPRRRGRGKVA